MPRTSSLFDIIKELQRRVAVLERNRQRFTSDLIGVSSVNTQHIVDLAVDNAKISDLAAGKLTAGTITVAVGVGDVARVKIDGANNRIIINDGIDDRILIGYQSGGF